MKKENFKGYKIKSSQLLQRIKDNFSNLSPGEKRVAKYIVDNYKKASFLTSMEIANEVDVSDTTVIRFANSLKYKGFIDFKKNLKELVKKKITPREKLSSTIEELKKEDDYLKQLYDLACLNLKRTFEELDFKTISKVVNILSNARKIFVIGLGISSVDVQYFSFRLKMIRKDIVGITFGSYSLVTELALLTDQDVFLAFDVPRYSRETCLALKYAKEIGAFTILITDSLINPLQEYSNETLIGFNECLGFTNSIIGSSFLVNLLSVGIILKEKNQALSSLEKLEKFSKELSHCL